METMRILTLTLAALLFVGCAPKQDTSGSQCKSILAGDIVVTEFMNDPPSTDTGHEWFELHNATTKDISLQGLTLFVSRADGTSEKSHVISKPLTLPASGYLAVGDVRDATLLPPYISYSYLDSLGSLSNSDGTIGVRCGSTSVIDKVVYNTAPQAGHSRQLDGRLSPDSSINDTEANFCDGVNEFDTGAFGTPGQKNDLCQTTAQTGTCLDPDMGVARDVNQPNVGDLVITEFMANPKAVSDTDGEWFEVLARRDVDLNGLQLLGGSSKTTVSNNQCLSVLSGDYAVFARKPGLGVDGGTTQVAAQFTFPLANTSGTLSVARADGTVIDAVQWASVLDGVSTQLDPGKLDPSLNDDAANFCAATSLMDTGDKGTPGAPNSACPTVGAADTCVDPGTGSARPLMTPQEGDLVISEFMADPTTVADTAGEWFEVYVPGDVDLNGLKLGNEGTSTTTLTSTACIHPDAGSYVVFAKNADPSVNGGLPEVLATFGFSLANSGARSIRVTLNDGGVLDQISYSSAVPGVSTQLDPSMLDPLSNDDAGTYCRSDAGTYGTAGNVGSPGAPNNPCQ